MPFEGNKGLWCPPTNKAQLQSRQHDIHHKQAQNGRGWWDEHGYGGRNHHQQFRESKKNNGRGGVFLVLLGFPLISTLHTFSASPRKPIGKPFSRTVCGVRQTNSQTLLASPSAVIMVRLRAAGRLSIILHCYFLSKLKGKQLHSLVKYTPLDSELLVDSLRKILCLANCVVFDAQNLTTLFLLHKQLERELEERNWRDIRKEPPSTLYGEFSIRSPLKISPKFSLADFTPSSGSQKGRE